MRLLNIMCHTKRR